MSTRFLMRSGLLAVAAAMPFACAQETTTPLQPSANVAPFATGLVTLEWQEQARNLVAANRLNPLQAARVYAALSVAQSRALNQADAVVPASEADPTGFGPGGRSRYEARRGAVAGASARVLGFLFPAAANQLEQTLNAQGDAGPGHVHPQFTSAIAMGHTAGDAMINHLQKDGFTKPWTGTVPSGPGLWIPSALPPAGGVLPDVTPYFLTSGSQFRPAPPPAFGSAAFNTDLNEVLTRSQNRTADELAFARHWDFSTGSPTPIGFWNGVAADYVAQSNLDERAATQVFALMQPAIFDALIGCWDAKYHYWVLRPTQANSAISLAFALPNHPSFPSGHSCASASAARVLTHFFPDRVGQLNGWVNDAGLSRIIAGIHYRFDIKAGETLGRSVADWAIAHAQ
ncbi:MAG: vanadium-dependent haloperoxidase [Gemmatimonadota bacterium]